MTRQRLFLLAMISLFVVFMTWAVYAFFTSKYPGAVDFRQRWGAIHDFWTEGLNPYSDEATHRTEMAIFGAPAARSQNQNPGDFIYPMYTAILLAPLSLLPYELAEAIWLVLIGVLLELSFRALVDMLNWRPPLWLSVGGTVWALFFYPGLRGLLLGQPGTFVACLELLAIWALAKRHDTLAGVLLGVSLIKPTSGFLLIPFLALWALRYKRWQFILSFGALTVFLVAVSFVLLPTWLTDWLRQVADYPSYTDIGSPVWIVTHMALPFLGTIGELVLSGFLIALMLWAWWVSLWKMRSATLDWTIALTLTVTMLIAPRTATPPHFVVFMFVLVFWFRLILRNDPQHGTFWVGGIMLLTSVGLWWLFLSTLLPYRVEHPINYLPLPLICLVVLLVTRQQWWNSVPSFTPATQQLVLD